MSGYNLCVMFWLLLLLLLVAKLLSQSFSLFNPLLPLLPEVTHKLLWEIFSELLTLLKGISASRFDSSSEVVRPNVADVLKERGKDEAAVAATVTVDDDVKGGGDTDDDVTIAK